MRRRRSSRRRVFSRRVFSRGGSRRRRGAINRRIGFRM